MKTKEIAEEILNDGYYDLEGLEELAQAYLSLLAKQDGMALVPLEPTEGMIEAAKRYLRSDSKTNIWAAYGAMLRANDE